MLKSDLEENKRLKARLIYQERMIEEGFFGSGTPSAKIPVKANTPLKITKPSRSPLMP